MAKKDLLPLEAAASEVEESKDIIIVKQLPIIEERLQEISTQLLVKVDNALKLPCTEETRKEVKSILADLRKDFKDLEQKRISVKNAVLGPYEKFEQVYKSLITDIFKPAEADLKSKIDEVENGIKEQLKEAVMEFFKEECEANKLDFLSFEDVGLNITLSSRESTLKKKVAEFIERVKSDLALIESQEHNEDILVEYKANGLNSSKAILTVKERYEAIEAEKRRREEAEKQRRAEEARRKAMENFHTIDEPPAEIPDEAFTVPTAEEAPEDEVQQPLPEASNELHEAPEKLYDVAFKIKRATKAQVIELKRFLRDGGYEYE